MKTDTIRPPSTFYKASVTTGHWYHLCHSDPCCSDRKHKLCLFHCEICWQHFIHSWKSSSYLCVVCYLVFCLNPFIYKKVVGTQAYCYQKVGQSSRQYWLGQLLSLVQNFCFNLVCAFKWIWVYFWALWKFLLLSLFLNQYPLISIIKSL